MAIVNEKGLITSKDVGATRKDFLKAKDDESIVNTEVEEIEYIVDEEEDLNDEIEETDEIDEEEIDDEPKYTKAQVSKLVQTRVGKLKKSMKSLSEYKDLVTNLADMTGMDVNAFKARVSSLSPEDQATILGVPKEQVATVLAQRATTKSKRKEQSVELKLQKAELKGNKAYADLELFEEDIDQLLEENPQLTVKQAYTLTKAELGLTSKVDVKAQADRAKRVKAAQTKKIVTAAGGTGGTGRKQVKVSKDIAIAAKRVGMDVGEYMAYSNINNIDDYMAYQSKRKGK